MKLLPKKVVTLILSYSCEKCGNEHWVNKEEACIPGFLFVCGSCGHVNKIEPITIKHVINPINKVDTIKCNLTTENPQKTTNIDQVKVINILKGYGYGVREVKPIIEDCLRKGGVETEQDLVKYVFNNV